jgi:hypothetical protein
VPVGGSLNMSSSAGFAYDASIAFLGGSPYVAWTERSQSGNAQVFVKMFNGTAWVLVGTGTLNKDVNTGWAFRPSIVADSASGSLYVGWVEQQALGQRPQGYVSRLSGGTWTALGGSLNVDPLNGSAQRMSLAVTGGQPVAAWGELNYGSMRQIFARQWNGTSWAQVAGAVSVPANACDLNGDGSVGAADVQMAINQVLGLAPCGSGDVNHDGRCNVADVQSVIIASMGGVCSTTSK